MTGIIRTLWEHELSTRRHEKISYHPLHQFSPLFHGHFLVDQAIICGHSDLVLAPKVWVEYWRQRGGTRIKSLTRYGARLEGTDWCLSASCASSSAAASAAQEFALCLMKSSWSCGDISLIWAGSILASDRIWLAAWHWHESVVFNWISLALLFPQWEISAREILHLTDRI